MNIFDLQKMLEKRCDSVVSEMEKSYSDRENHDSMAMRNDVVMMQVQIGILELLKRPS